MGHSPPEGHAPPSQWPSPGKNGGHGSQQVPDIPERVTPFFSPCLCLHPHPFWNKPRLPVPASQGWAMRTGLAQSGGSWLVAQGCLAPGNKMFLAAKKEKKIL